MVGDSQTYVSPESSIHDQTPAFIAKMAKITYQGKFASQGQVNLRIATWSTTLIELIKSQGKKRIVGTHCHMVTAGFFLNWCPAA
jgi:hypothetical protein